MMYIATAIAVAALVWLLDLLFVQVRLLVYRIRLDALLRKRAVLKKREEDNGV